MRYECLTYIISKEVNFGNLPSLKLPQSLFEYGQASLVKVGIDLLHKEQWDLVRLLSGLLFDFLFFFLLVFFLFQYDFFLDLIQNLRMI